MLHQVLDVSSSKFSLIRLYPRKDLDSSVDSHSMSELNLVPTGVVIVRMNQVQLPQHLMPV